MLNGGLRVLTTNSGSGCGTWMTAPADQASERVTRPWHAVGLATNARSRGAPQGYRSFEGKMTKLHRREENVGAATITMMLTSADLDEIDTGIWPITARGPPRQPES